MSLIRKISRRLSPRPRVREVRIERLDAIAEWMYWESKSERLRFFLPTGILRMHGAFAYAGGVHPFLEALGSGSEALSGFYTAHRPTDVASAHCLDGATPGTGPSNLPWIWREAEYTYSGEKGLGPEHGISMYGPCSPEKVALELSRLVRLRRLVAERGYDPDRYGDIQGAFLRRGGEFRFFVKGGKHRAAVLASLEWPQIPVSFAHYWPRVIDVADIDSWPLVRQRRISREMAMAVFDSYFDFDGTQQYRRLGLEKPASGLA